MIFIVLTLLIQYSIWYKHDSAFQTELQFELFIWKKQGLVYKTKCADLEFA